MKNFIKKMLILSAIFTGLTLFVNAQDFLPFLNDNHAGINQATLQPASIADSRFAVDINIIGISEEIRSDFIRFKKKATWNLFKDYDDPDYFEHNSYLDDPDGTAKNAILNFQVILPSFLITIDNKQAIGLISRVRDIWNVDNIDEPLARGIYSSFEDSEYWQQLKNPNDRFHHGTKISGTHHTFAEYGFSYAREIIDLGDHYIKGGLTIKLMQGIASTYLWMDDLYYWLEKDPNTVDPSDPHSFDADSASWNTPYAYFGTSENWKSKENYPVPPFEKYNFTSKPSVGLDIGFVYEWRPESERFKYDMDGHKDLYRKDLNKYKIKVGASVLDIGRLKYDKFNNSSDFMANFTPGYPNVTPTVGNTAWMLLDSLDMNSPPYYDFNDTVQNRYPTGSTAPMPGNEGTYVMKLPTALSFQLDYNINDAFYVCLTTYTALVKSSAGKPSSHYVSNYSITPRYEGKWLGASIPVQYNAYKQFLVGFGVRLGILWIGTNDLLSLVGFTKGYGSNLQFALKIPIIYKGPPSDMDGDGISDYNDKCPTVPGVIDFDGCPDKDMDGVPDNEDLCPDDPGLKEYNGCPDRDADGIIDKLDDCPSEPGLEEFNGCPDTDGDGIIDKHDRCPNTPGIEAFFGCPDTDGDGIPDNEDLCPTEPGPRHTQGCPYEDTDGDGVLDKDDKCPLTPGDPANYGCPIIKEAEIAIINTAFANLEFQTNKSIILAGSYASLNELAGLLKRKPDWNLRVAGHTDSQGNDEYNMQLSKARAEAVANYLEDQGVEGHRLQIEYFGETQPIGDNSTASGRAKNRRVEMEIIFD